MPRLFVLFFILCYAPPALAQHGQQAAFNQLMAMPVFEDALDYKTIPKIGDCQEHTIKPPKYHKCRDSAAIYARAHKNAKTANWPLMVIFGFDTCPPCAALDKSVFHSKNPMTNDKIVRYFSKPALNDYAAKGEPLKIMVVYIHSRAKHGQQLAEGLGLESPLRPPFILLVDPVSGAKYSKSTAQSKDRYCEWGAEFAAGLEGIGLIAKGESFQVRERC